MKTLAKVLEYIFYAWFAVMVLTGVVGTTWLVVLFWRALLTGEI